MLPIKRVYPSISFFDFDDFFDLAFFKHNDVSSSKCPIHDVIENDKEYVVELLLGGIKKEDISINIEKDVLIIKAERKETKNLKEDKYNRHELFIGKYERLFVLPDSINVENIGASLIDGILKIIIPKIEDDKKVNKKKIEIM